MEAALWWEVAHSHFVLCFLSGSCRIWQDNLQTQPCKIALNLGQYSVQSTSHVPYIPLAGMCFSAVPSLLVFLLFQICYKNCEDIIDHHQICQTPLREGDESMQKVRTSSMLANLRCWPLAKILEIEMQISLIWCWINKEYFIWYSFVSFGNIPSIQQKVGKCFLLVLYI